MCAILPRPHVERNDKFFSWKSLFFYRCTDEISFAPLKSQPFCGINEPSNLHEQVKQVERLATQLRDYVISETRNNPPVEGHTPVEPTKAEEKAVLREKTKEGRRADYIRGKTVATAPPPCSPKTIYVLANLVR
jgi:hypothetical protein